MDTRLLSLIFTISVISIAFALIGIGWRSRLRRQADVVGLPQVPSTPGEPLAAADGQYVSTTTSGDWLDRIAVHSLGIRTNAELAVYPHGVVFDRSGVPPVYIPLSELTGVRQDSGMAGKFVEKEGLLVVSWQHGAVSLDTGFRTRHAADKEVLLQALQDLISSAPSADAHSGK